ncbi:hypothetical protein CNMCM5793_006582 [Aspergillus hiratsukae]|uniref:Uncharacterized protein n=1 Tax=Aspergillus hiratsukae TaxID=1194566 RepID=A0A8H6PGY9_9EURO|nr:hypothetical protein CNMCM5793_006582 [Aspergillus hiratsukae]
MKLSYLCVTAVMDGSLLTDTELQLTRERSLKYKGTAKVYINQIVAHPSISRGLDPKNVDRLCEIFSRDRCRRLDVRNHVTAVVSRQHLEMALASAGVQCLHGQHRLKAAEELLPPSDQWWTVDLYLDDISSNLQAALVDEYSNEKVPSDGEVYLKVRQYQYEGNARFEERWMARLTANKAKRFRQLTSRVDVRAAFDRLRIIPALLLQGMKFGSIPRALAMNCYEEMVHGLGSLLESWSYYVRGDRAKMLKIDPHTVETLQGFAPSVSVKDAKVVKGLVLSGEVFSKFTSSERKAIWKRLKRRKRRKTIIPSLHTFFQDMWYLEACANCMKRLVNPCQRYPSVKSAFLGVFKVDPNNGDCLIQTSETDFRHQRASQSDRAEVGYRQLWLYAMRHYPQIPREQRNDNLVAKPGYEKADEMILHDMAVLAQRLGFDSPHIQNLIQQSPDRQMARDILLKARKPDRYQYPEDIFESLVTRICDCFSEAVSLDHPTSPEPAMAREVKLNERYGLPHRNDQRQDSRLLFLDELHADNVPLDRKVTTLCVRRCFYFAFFGQLPTAISLSPARTSSPSSDGSLPHSPLFVPDDGLLVPVASVVSPTQRRREGRTDGQSHREAARQDRRRRKQEAKERRRQERQRRRELRRSSPPHDYSPAIRDTDDHDMEEVPDNEWRPSPVSIHLGERPLAHLEEPEGMEGERTNMEVDSPAIPSNACQNNDEEMEESNGFHSDSERASTATQVQFGEESEAAPDRAIVERTSTGEALTQPAADVPGVLEMELQRELDRLQREAEERAKAAEQGNRGPESPAAERAISVRRSFTDVEDALEKRTVHSNDQVEARQELLQDVLVERSERQDVGSIASTDGPATPSQASNKKAMTNKDKRQGGIAKWAPYDATAKGKRRADRGQRVTRVDFTALELSSNQWSTSNVLQPAIEDHTENESIRPEDRLVEFEGLDRSEVLPTTFAENTIPDIVIHAIAEQADTSAAPLESEVVEPRRNSSDEGRVAAPADLVMEEAISRPLEASSKKSAQIKGKGQQIDPKWAPYDPIRKENRKRVERHTPGREPQGQQHTRPVTQITFSGMELALSQQPPEIAAITEHRLLHPEATIPGRSHTSNDLDVPAVAQEQLASGALQGQAGTVDNPARRPLRMKTSNLSGAKTAKKTPSRERRRKLSRPLGIKAATRHEKQTKGGVDRAPLSGEHRLSLSTVTHLELPPLTEDAAQSPMANTISDQEPPEVHLTTRTDEQRISETWEKRQRRLSRPMGIKKTREKVRAQDRQNRNTQARQNQGPVTESSGPIPHRDGQKSRAEKVVTRINFEGWAKRMGQGERDASSMPVPEAPTITEPTETASPGDQPTTVMAESNQAATARSARKILKPHIVVRPAREARTVPSEPNPDSQAVTIVFRARGDDGIWKTVHELQVDPSEPSEVERVARKDARNRNATFYDKNLRKLTPAQCFEAAIEDETNTIFMKFDGELVMDEETMASIARDIEL